MPFANNVRKSIHKDDFKTFQRLLKDSKRLEEIEKLLKCDLLHQLAQCGRTEWLIWFVNSMTLLSSFNLVVLSRLEDEYPNLINFAVKNNEDKTILHEAAQFGQVEFAQFVIHRTKGRVNRIV